MSIMEWVNSSEGWINGTIIKTVTTLKRQVLSVGVHELNFI